MERRSWACPRGRRGWWRCRGSTQNWKLRWVDTTWAPKLAGSRRGQRQTCQFSQLMLEFCGTKLLKTSIPLLFCLNSSSTTWSSRHASKHTCMYFARLQVEARNLPYQQSRLHLVIPLCLVLVNSVHPMGGESLLVSTVHNLWQNLVHSVKKTVAQSYSYNNRWPPQGRMTDRSCFCHELAKNIQLFGKKKHSRCQI